MAAPERAEIRAMRASSLLLARKPDSDVYRSFFFTEQRFRMLPIICIPIWRPSYRIVSVNSGNWWVTFACFGSPSQVSSLAWRTPFALDINGTGAAHSGKKTEHNATLVGLARNRWRTGLRTERRSMRHPLFGNRVAPVFIPGVHEVDTNPA
jgi:hypothetical protein